VHRDKCLFCKQPVKISPSSDDKKFYDCPQCGTFSISGSLKASISNGYAKEQGSKLSSWISEQNIIFNTDDVYLHSDIFDQTLAQQDKKYINTIFFKITSSLCLSLSNITSLIFNHLFDTRVAISIKYIYFL